MLPLFHWDFGVSSFHPNQELAEFTWHGRHIWTRVLGCSRHSLPVILPVLSHPGANSCPHTSSLPQSGVLLPYRQGHHQRHCAHVSNVNSNPLTPSAPAMHAVTALIYQYKYAYISVYIASMSGGLTLCSTQPASKRPNSAYSNIAPARPARLPCAPQTPLSIHRWQARGEVCQPS